MPVGSQVKLKGKAVLHRDTPIKGTNVSIPAQALQFEHTSSLSLGKLATRSSMSRRRRASKRALRRRLHKHWSSLVGS